MQEEEFFSHGNVSVTRSRFIVGSQTYAMSGITSVEGSAIKPRRTGPVLLCAIGVLLVIASVQAGNSPGFVFFGVVLALLGAFLFWRQKAEYIVQLRTSAGDVKALSSEHDHYINKVIEALNKAIVSRG